MFKYSLHAFFLLTLFSCGKENQLKEMPQLASINNEQAEKIDLKVISLSHRKNKVDRHIVETLVKSATFENNGQLGERDEFLERRGQFKLLFDYLDEMPNYLDFKIEFNRKLSDESFSLFVVDTKHESFLIDKNIVFFPLGGKKYRFVYKLPEQYSGMRILLKSESLSFNKNSMGKIQKKANEKIHRLGHKSGLRGDSLIQFESSSKDLSFILPFYMLNQSLKKNTYFSEASEVELGRVCQQNHMKLHLGALFEKLPIFETSRSEVILKNGVADTTERVESRNRRFLGYKKQRIEDSLKEFVIVDEKGKSLAITRLHHKSKLYSFDHPFFSSCPSVRIKLKKSSWIENVEVGTIWTKDNRVDLNTGLISEVSHRNFIEVASGLIKKELMSVEHEKSLFGYVELY
ncbi:hypothetical protein HBN50_13105 [Halobacteriovorax sp. GB3]|uniref:hypothetical protein n=1 Tax=Halobacteriovorax sp. GB3 TaxID=2719615 RepID=UPI002362E0ED|nr:hypothetical protein [Halobacteriovorax sp. GB3]MDD0854044.1 hypothetical protein [Halobacteriovorax sp. GB3]